MAKIAVAGAGFSGAVIAHELAGEGHEVDVFESRAHVAGNCHTERDADSGILVHRYGPHIFHTSNERVWNYVRRFDEFMPFTNRVKAVASEPRAHRARTPRRPWPPSPSRKAAWTCCRWQPA